MSAPITEQNPVSAAMLAWTQSKDADPLGSSVLGDTTTTRYRSRATGRTIVRIVRECPIQRVGPRLLSLKDDYEYQDEETWHVEESDGESIEIGRPERLPEILALQGRWTIGEEASLADVEQWLKSHLAEMRVSGGGNMYAVRISSREGHVTSKGTTFAHAIKAASRAFAALKGAS